MRTTASVRNAEKHYPHKQYVETLTLWTGVQHVTRATAQLSPVRVVTRVRLHRGVDAVCKPITVLTGGWKLKSKILHEGNI